jgi:hypothetical protein
MQPWIAPRCPRKTFRLLQRAHAGVIIKFDLPSPETMYYAPAVTLCELAYLRLGYCSQNSQLRRLRDNVLRSA